MHDTWFYFVTNEKLSVCLSAQCATMFKQIPKVKTQFTRLKRKSCPAVYKKQKAAKTLVNPP